MASWAKPILKSWYSLALKPCGVGFLVIHLISVLFFGNTPSVDAFVCSGGSSVHAKSVPRGQQLVDGISGVSCRYGPRDVTPSSVEPRIASVSYIGPARRAHLPLCAEDEIGGEAGGQIHLANGEVRSRTEWHRVVIFDQGLVDLVENYVHKGRRLYLEGSLQTRRWVSSDGHERYTTEVLLAKYKGELVLLESPEEKQQVSDASTETVNIPRPNTVASGRTSGNYGTQSLNAQTRQHWR